MLRAGVDHLRVVRMDGNGPYLSLLRQAVGEGLPVVIFHRPAEEPTKIFAANLRGWHMCGASVNIRRCVRHKMSSLIHESACTRTCCYIRDNRHRNIAVHLGQFPGRQITVMSKASSASRFSSMSEMCNSALPPLQYAMRDAISSSACSMRLTGSPVETAQISGLEQRVAADETGLGHAAPSVRRHHAR